MVELFCGQRMMLGMECIDKGMYQKWINKNEAEIEVLKEKI